MAEFDPRLLARIAEADEVEVETHRPARTARRTIIWIVVEGGRVYVRSIKGDRGVWYRELRADPDAALRLDADRLPVRASAVTDADEVARVTEAYHRKYGRSPYLNGVVKPESLSGTLRLAPR